MGNISTRMVILVAAVGLSLAGTADAAFAEPQSGYSDGYGYDKNGVFNDGLGYDKNGVFDDGLGYTDSSDSTSDFNCYDNRADGAYGYDNCGWYDGSFYPGFGIFVFDRHHHRHRMTGRQHDYFTRQARGHDGGRSRGGFGGGGRGGFGGGMSRGFHGGGGRHG